MATLRRSRKPERSPRSRAISFLKGEVDEVRIVTTRFVNTLTQEPVILSTSQSAPSRD